MSCMHRDSRVIVNRAHAQQELSSKSYEKKILDDSAPASVFIGRARNNNENKSDHICIPSSYPQMLCQTGCNSCDINSVITAAG